MSPASVWAEPLDALDGFPNAKRYRAFVVAVAEGIVQTIEADDGEWIAADQEGKRGRELACYATQVCVFLSACALLYHAPKWSADEARAREQLRRILDPSNDDNARGWFLDRKEISPFLHLLPKDRVANVVRRVVAGTEPRKPPRVPRLRVAANAAAAALTAALAPEVAR